MDVRGAGFRTLVDLPLGRFDFPFAGWEVEFGVYQWFYVRGVRQTLSLMGIYTRRELTQRLGLVPDRIPSRWVEDFPMGDWGALSHVQVARVLDGRPVRFDKALMVIALMLIISSDLSDKEDRKIDVLEMLKISPAFFVLDNIRDALRAIRKSPKDLSIYIKQNEMFIDSIMRWGFPISYFNAEKIESYCLINDYHGLQIRMLHDRTDKGRLVQKSPSNYEIVF